jgi:multiple sugar transport system ATP-binding protein
MATVSLERIVKRFPDGTLAVDGVDLEIFDREFLVVVGPSGCGKSTTLRLIAGLETCTSGEVRIGGRSVNAVAPRDRDVAMVFQSYALYPQLSVYRNLTFGLKLRFGGGVLARGLRKIFQPRRSAELARLRDGIDLQVRQAAQRLSIEHLLNKKPHQLSGGECQRVALGRAIVREPAAFLLDEPLSNLDTKLRQQMRGELRRLHRELQTTIVYVTHDQVDAMTLGDRVAVMNEGRVVQVGRPLEIYQRPANLFVAQFFGTAPINLVPGTVIRTAAGCEFSGHKLRLVLNEDESQVLHRLFSVGETRVKVVLGFRPESVTRTDISPAAVEESAGNTGLEFESNVFEVDRLGESTLAHLQFDDVESQGESSGSLVVRLPAESEVEPGDRLRLEIDRGKILLFDPESGQNLLKEIK